MWPHVWGRCAKQAHREASCRPDDSVSWLLQLRLQQEGHLDAVCIVCNAHAAEGVILASQVGSEGGHKLVLGTPHVTGPAKQRWLTQWYVLLAQPQEPSCSA